MAQYIYQLPVWEELKSNMQRLNAAFGFGLLENVGELFEEGRAMNGWCWQSSSFIAALGNDEDVVKRGVIRLSKNSPRNYEHGWIEIKRKGVEYVLDPALGELMEKNEYYNRHDPDIKGMVTSKDIKAFLLERWNNPEFRIKHSWEEGEDGEKQWECLKGSEDISAPIFRGKHDYRLDVENNEIKNIELYCYI